jgi:thiol-disulfide isomerase/thioredoxin
MEFNNIVNLANLKHNNDPVNINNNEPSVQLKLLNDFDKLVTLFNNTVKKENKKFLTKIVQNMRVIHGKIIKLFFDQLKDQGNFNHEEYYILSMMDTSYTNTRAIIKQAENYITGNTKNLLDTVELNEETSINNKDNLVFKEHDTKIDLSLPTMVLFYTDWCGHCKHFKPTWNEFKRVTSKQHINLVSTNDDKLMAKYNVNGIPNIKFFNNDKVEEYNSGMTISDLADYINSKLDKIVSKPEV